MGKRADGRQRAPCDMYERRRRQARAVVALSAPQQQFDLERARYLLTMPMGIGDGQEGGAEPPGATFASACVCHCSGSQFGDGSQDSVWSGLWEDARVGRGEGLAVYD